MIWVFVVFAGVIPALAPAFARRWGAALGIGLLAVAAMASGLWLAWPALLLLGWVIAHRAEKADRKAAIEAQRHAELIAASRSR
jgi:hypothetical protein